MEGTELIVVSVEAEKEIIVVEVADVSCRIKLQV